MNKCTSMLFRIGYMRRYGKPNAYQLDKSSLSEKSQVLRSDKPGLSEKPGFLLIKQAFLCKTLVFIR